MGRMGIEVLSFVIKDVVDNVDYLSSIGRAQSAIVKKDAAIGVAEAERDSGIVVSHAIWCRFLSIFVFNHAYKPRALHVFATATQSTLVSI